MLLHLFLKSLLGKSLKIIKTSSKVIIVTSLSSIPSHCFLLLPSNILFYLLFTELCSSIRLILSSFLIKILIVFLMPFLRITLERTIAIGFLLTLIILLSCCLIRQHLICFINFFKFLFSSLISIRMILLSQLFKCLLDIGAICFIR